MQKRTLKEQLEAFKKIVESWHSRKDMELLTVKAAARQMLKAYDELAKEMFDTAKSMRDFYDPRSDIEIPMDECDDTMQMYAEHIEETVGGKSSSAEPESRV